MGADKICEVIQRFPTVDHIISKDTWWIQSTNFYV
jgi:hypothetical protein